MASKKRPKKYLPTLPDGWRYQKNGDVIVIPFEIDPQKSAAALVASFNFSLPGYVFWKMERRYSKGRIYLQRE